MAVVCMLSRPATPINKTVIPDEDFEQRESTLLAVRSPGRPLRVAGAHSCIECTTERRIRYNF